MIFKASDNKFLFVFRDMDSIRNDEKYDVIITPQLYIMKKDELPIKYSFQAKNIAPSMLDEFSQSENLRYEVFKDGNEWVFVAYDSEEIEELLLSKGLKPEQIGRVYFAQQFKDQLENRIIILNLNRDSSLSVIDGVVTFIPISLVSSEYSTLSIENLKRPKDSFSLKLKSSNKGEPPIQ